MVIDFPFFLRLVRLKNKGSLKLIPTVVAQVVAVSRTIFA